MVRHWRCLFVAGCCLFASLSQGAAAAELNEAEQAFADLLTSSAMVGRFSIDGRDTPPKEERYEISKAQKLGGSKWLVTARIKYGQNDIEVPVAVDVHWAGDTPVLSVTDIKIPGLGEGFTTRVLFYKDRYAGSWYHGQAGGHMWGKLEASEDEDKVSLKDLSEEDRRVVEKLDERCRVRFHETPLKDAITFLSRAFDVDITFNADVPERLQREPITLMSNYEHRLGHALPRVLSRVELAPYIADGGIVIRNAGSPGVLAVSHQREQSIQDALQKVVTADFIACPLSTAAEFLSDSGRVDVELAPDVNGATEINFPAEEFPLGLALTVMLSEVGLEATEELGCLLIHPKEKEDEDQIKEEDQVKKE